jgi:O-antigen ligase
MIEKKRIFPKEQILRLLVELIIPLGLGFFLLSIFFLPDRNAFKTFFYITVLAPVLITIILDIRILKSALKSSTLLLIIAFLTYASLTLFWSDTDRTFFHFLKRELYILALIFSFAITSSNDRFSLKKTLFVTCVGASCFSLFFIIKDFNTVIAHNGRISGGGVLYNPLLSAHVFGFFWALLAASLLELKLDRTWSIIIFVLLVPITLFIFFTGSRTPLLAMALMFTFYLFLQIDRKRLIILTLLITTGLLVFIFFPEHFSNRGLSYRPWIWEQTIGVIKDHPILGIGVSNSFTVPKPFDPSQVWMEPHNIHLAVFLYMGVAGFILWGLIYLDLLKSAFGKDSSKESRVAALVLVFGASCALTEGGAFFSRPKEQWFIIWIPIALAVTVKLGNILKQALSTHKKI